jgi:class 3 adenylate cyclase
LRTLWELYETLISPPAAEGGRTVWMQEEARAERMAASLRVLYLIVWLVSTSTTTAVNSAVANRVNLGMGGLWFLAAAAYLAWLRRRPYKPSYKYLSLTADILISTAMLFLYQYDGLGGTSTLKSPTFMNFYLILVLAALRFDGTLPVYGGALAVGLYASIVIYLAATGRVSLGTREEMYTTAKVNGVFLFYNAVYLGLFTAVLAVFVRNVRRLVTLRAWEAQRAFLERSKRRRTLQTLERYFTPQVAKHLLANPQELGGRVQEATILVGDVRDFTRLSEALGPARTMEVLNGFFERMVEIIFRHGGTLDKFLGDGMLVAFGVPRARPDDALRAVRAAHEMSRTALVAGGLRLQVGLAVHTGEVLMGNVGSSARMEFTVIGDTVNTACRMEALNKQFRTDIILSQATLEKVKASVDARVLPPAEIRGKEGAVTLYQFLGWKGEP